MIPIGNVNYSLDSFISARRLSCELPNTDFTWIQKYTRKGVDKLLERSSDIDFRWKALTDTVLVLHLHKNPIVRHEAAFVLGQFDYQQDLERAVAVRNLRFCMREDPAIVPRHEAIEALGESKTFCSYSVGAAADLLKINRFWPDYLDVQATVDEAYSNIKEWLKSRPEFKKVVEELNTWESIAKMKGAENLHTRKSNLNLFYSTKID
ncbi:MAG: HEAT repeat domain-containing protein [Nanoarchaeota archaeon]